MIIYDYINVASNTVKILGVTIADVDQSRGQKAVHACIEEFGFGRVIFVRTDVTSEFELEGEPCHSQKIKKQFNVFLRFRGIQENNKQFSTTGHCHQQCLNCKRGALGENDIG